MRSHLRVPALLVLASLAAPVGLAAGPTLDIDAASGCLVAVTSCGPDEKRGCETGGGGVTCNLVGLPGGAQVPLDAHGGPERGCEVGSGGVTCDLLHAPAPPRALQ